MPSYPVKPEERRRQSVEMAIDVLTYYFDEFTKKHYDKIQRGLNLH